jgi:septal ring factor EnvC (AmiA/AmiB activator)
MLEAIEELEDSLKAQLDSLAKDIRTAEASLITTKEGFLKVQGALEILNILKDKLKGDEDRSNLATALG